MQTHVFVALLSNQQQRHKKNRALVFDQIRLQVRVFKALAKAVCHSQESPRLVLTDDECNLETTPLTTQRRAVLFDLEDLTPNFLKTDQALVGRCFQTETQIDAGQPNSLLAFCREALRENISDYEEDE